MPEDWRECYQCLLRCGGYSADSSQGKPQEARPLPCGDDQAGKGCRQGSQCYFQKAQGSDAGSAQSYLQTDLSYSSGLSFGMDLQKGEAISYESLKKFVYLQVIYIIDYGKN